MTETITKLKDAPGQGAARSVTYWRVEGSLLEVGAMRLVGFFTWNAQSFAERWARRLGMAAMALSRPFAYAASRTFATRLLHTLLRGVVQRVDVNHGDVLRQRLAIYKNLKAFYLDFVAGQATGCRVEYIMQPASMPTKWKPTKIVG